MRLTTTNKYVSREMICRNEDCGVKEEHCPHLMEDECACLREVINKLSEYEDEEEQGLLLRLPCKVGDTVYLIESECEGDIYDCSHCCEHCACLNTFVAEVKFDAEWFDCIGKTVFLTREEAEAALAEKGGAE